VSPATEDPHRKDWIDFVSSGFVNPSAGKAIDSRMGDRKKPILLSPFCCLNQFPKSHIVLICSITAEQHRAPLLLTNFTSLQTRELVK
jgi:hypothetical protein